MPGRRPNVTKRKARDSVGDSKTKGPVKVQRTTLDAFFAPRQTVPGVPPVVGTTAKESLKNSLPENNLAGGHNVGLSAEQEKVLRMVVDDESNIFFTGSAGLWHDFSKVGQEPPFDYHNADHHAGTGKSLLLRAIIEALKKKYAKKAECLAICASTGMAAQNIGGLYPGYCP